MLAPKLEQSLSYTLRDIDTQCPFQLIAGGSALPAAQARTEIRAPAVLFSGSIDFNGAVSRSNEANKVALGVFIATNDTGAKWYVLRARSLSPGAHLGLIWHGLPPGYRED